MTQDRLITPPPAQTPSPRLAYRPIEVARMLGIPRSTLYEMLRRGDIRSVRIGGPPGGILLITAAEIARVLSCPLPRAPAGAPRGWKGAS